MKKRSLVLVILFFCISQVEAKKKVSGFFITNTHDTIKVVFDISFGFLSQEPDYEKLQSKVKYFDSNNVKQTLSPDMAIEVCLDIKGKKVRMLSRNNDLDFYGESKLFLHLIKDGRMKLFEHHSTSMSGPMGPNGTMTTSKSVKEILQIDNGLLFKPRFLVFRKDMLEFLSGCPILSKKIEERVYNSFDMEKIVDDYNLNCR